MSPEHVTELSPNARRLLDRLIWGGDDWWRVVARKSARNAAMDQLLAHHLIEVDQVGGVCRATTRGVMSNDAYRTRQYDVGYMAGALPEAQGHRPPSKRPGLEEPYRRGYYDGFVAYFTEQLGSDQEGSRLTAEHYLHDWCGIHVPG